MNDFQQFQDDLVAWARATFAKQNAMGSLKHLQLEVGELIEKPDDPMEYADCFMLLIDAAAFAGINMEQLLDFAKQKLEICKQRKWSDLDEDGISQHIEEMPDTVCPECAHDCYGDKPKRYCLECDWNEC